ncbi:hypothetical protein HDV00_003065 [Rhizophlyctis rosea]|nr:hypothetical protein HDV00_003065 [Rhizophlyctis rosea]
MDFANAKTEIALVTTSALLIIAYHGYLFFNIRKHGPRTVIGLTRAARRKWLVSLIKRKNEIVVIQGLRNQLMASTFLASTAVAITSALAAFTASTTSLLTTSQTPAETSPHFARLVALLICYVFSFFCFTQSIRYYNHLVFMTDADVWEELNADGSGLCMLDYAGTFFTLGLRGYYISFLIVAWFFGPVVFVGATILLLSALSWLDWSRGMVRGAKPSKDEREESEGAELRKLVRASDRNI